MWSDGVKWGKSKVYGVEKWKLAAALSSLAALGVGIHFSAPGDVNLADVLNQSEPSSSLLDDVPSTSSKVLHHLSRIFALAAVVAHYFSDSSKAEYVSNRLKAEPKSIGDVPERKEIQNPNVYSENVLECSQSYDSQSDDSQSYYSLSDDSQSNDSYFRFKGDLNWPQGLIIDFEGDLNWPEGLLIDKDACNQSDDSLSDVKSVLHTITYPIEASNAFVESLGTETDQFSIHNILRNQHLIDLGWEILQAIDPNIVREDDSTLSKKRREIKKKYKKNQEKSDLMNVLGRYNAFTDNIIGEKNKAYLEKEISFEERNKIFKGMFKGILADLDPLKNQTVKSKYP